MATLDVFDMFTRDYAREARELVAAQLAASYPRRQDAARIWRVAAAIGAPARFNRVLCATHALLPAKDRHCGFAHYAIRPKLVEQSGSEIAFSADSSMN